MNRKQWRDPEGHPPADLLLLHLEHELEGHGADAVRLHVDQCAQCRTDCEQIERGMGQFTAFRDSVVLPASAPRTTALRERLLAESASNNSPSLACRVRDFFRLNSPRRLTFAMGCACFCLIVWLSVFLGNPRQSVYASQILNQARSASDSLLAHSKVLHQKIRLRRGTVVLERSVQHGRQAVTRAEQPRIEPELQQEFELAHVDWNDPLNATDFADWRGAQPKRTDSVKETAQDVTITTSVTGAEITAQSLTLSRSGWRPIARSVEVRGEAPIEISEVSYEIGEAPSLMPANATSSPAPAVTATSGAATHATDVSSDDLETSELDLREALHAIGADVSAAPEISRTEDAVLFRVSPETARLAEAIRQATIRIPHVKEKDKQAPRLSEAPSPGRVSASGAAPPFAGALENRLGSAQAVKSFLDALHTRSTHVLAEAAALDQLGKRYSADAIRNLPPDLRARVNRLAASLLSSLQHDAADYLQATSPILDEMAQNLNVKEPADDGRNLPNCLTWQENAALAAPQLHDLDRSVSELFVSSQSGKPAAPAGELLANSLRARSFLERHLMSTCQLFGSNGPGR
jgi:hypothetical protein